MGLLHHRPKAARQGQRGTADGRPRLRRAAVAGLALATAATAAPVLLTATPASAVSGKGMAIGAYATGGSDELTQIEQGYGNPSLAIGKFDVDHEYVVFNGPKSVTSVVAKSRGKRVPYVNMALNCGCRSGKKGSPVAKGYWKKLASGGYDGWLTAQAKAVKAWPGTFILTWQHEPEQSYGWEGTPADYKAAWRHIVAVFYANGVGNVRFVTSFLPTSFRGTSPKVNQFWPGDDLGLIAGSTGYNWACSAHTGNKPGCGKGWKSFAAVFGPVNSWATKKKVRWWVTETGVAEDPSVPGRKAQWLNDARTTADHWPLLVGVMFFYGSRSHDLFLPKTSSSSVAAFRGMVSEWGG
jgi:hypothetical protein